MKYHVFNIGKPANTEWWAQNIQRGVITAGYDGDVGDRGHVILHDMDEGDWVIAYANTHGFVGAGLAKDISTYQLHVDIPAGSQSNHQHERGVDWIYVIDDVHNAITLPEAGRQQPRQTKEREANEGVAKKIINLIRRRAKQGEEIDFADAALDEAQDRLWQELPPIDSDHDSRVWELRAVAQRQGQPEFRTALLAAYSYRCAMTGCVVEAVLEAAHIIPHLGVHTMRVDNGLLLRADIHTLFDLGRLWIDPETMSIRIADSLFGTEYEKLLGKKIRLPCDKSLHPKQDHLVAHKQLAVGGKSARTAI